MKNLQEKLDKGIDKVFDATEKSMYKRLRVIIR